MSFVGCNGWLGSSPRRFDRIDSRDAGRASSCWVPAVFRLPTAAVAFSLLAARWRLVAQQMSEHGHEHNRISRAVDLGGGSGRIWAGRHAIAATPDSTRAACRTGARAGLSGATPSRAFGTRVCRGVAITRRLLREDASFLVAGEAGVAAAVRVAGAIFGSERAVWRNADLLHALLGWAPSLTASTRVDIAVDGFRPAERVRCFRARGGGRAGGAGSRARRCVRIGLLCVGVVTRGGGRHEHGEHEPSPVGGTVLRVLPSH